MLLLLASPGGESGRLLSTNANVSKKLKKTVDADGYNYTYSLVIVLLMTTIRK